MSATYVTTPIGAVIGLAVARKAIPVRNRGLVADAIGLGTGAGAGYVGGALYDQATHPTTPEGMIDQYVKDPGRFTSSPSKEERTVLTGGIKTNLKSDKSADRAIADSYMSPLIRRETIRNRLRLMEGVLTSGRLSGKDQERMALAVQKNRELLAKATDATPGTFGAGVGATLSKSLSWLPYVGRAFYSGTRSDELDYR